MAPIDQVAATLRHAGEGGRRIAVIGSAREVGTTRTAIALARTLAKNNRVVLVDLAFNSPNIDVFSNDPAAPGVADLVRGAASFGDIITRDKFSRLHLVAAGRVEGDASALLGSHMLLSAVDALGQSYDYLVVDAGAQSEAAMPRSRKSPRGRFWSPAKPRTIRSRRLRDQLLSSGFADVTVLTGPPPELNHAATSSAAA